MTSPAQPTAVVTEPVQQCRAIQSANVPRAGLGINAITNVQRGITYPAVDTENVRANKQREVPRKLHFASVTLHTRGKIVASRVLLVLEMQSVPDMLVVRAPCATMQVLVLVSMGTMVMLAKIFNCVQEIAMECMANASALPWTRNSANANVGGWEQAVPCNVL